MFDLGATLIDFENFVTIRPTPILRNDKPINATVTATTYNASCLPTLRIIAFFTWNKALTNPVDARTCRIFSRCSCKTISYRDRRANIEQPYCHASQRRQRKMWYHASRINSRWSVINVQDGIWWQQVPQQRYHRRGTWDTQNHPAGNPSIIERARRSPLSSTYFANTTTAKDWTFVTSSQTTLHTIVRSALAQY